MMPFLIGGAGQVVRSPDIFQSEACDISIANSVTVTSLTSVSASNLAEKFVIPSTWLDRVGAGVTLDLIMTIRNNEGSSRSITFNVLHNDTSVLNGATNALATAATNRPALLRVQLRRTGATTGLLATELQIGSFAAATGSGAVVGGFFSGVTSRGHNTGAPLPAVGSTTTLAITAAFPVANAELTLAVNRRRLYVW